MIKFFNKIRQKLLIENKTSRYFKYAFGEIILVVIGILIALQINNWNDVRIAKKNALVLSKRLLSETKKNKKELVSSILNVEKSKNAAFQLLKSFGEDYKKHNELLIDSLLLRTYTIYTYDFNTAVFDKVLSSGELSSIKNDSIETIMYQIKTIKKAYETTEDLLKHHANYNHYEFWKDKISLRKIDFYVSEEGKLIGNSQLKSIDNRAILANRVFENIIDDSYYIFNNLLTRYNALNERFTILIEALEQHSEN